MANQKPTGIKIEGGKNITLDSNTFIGDMNAIDAKNVENLKVTNNKQFIPTTKQIEQPKEPLINFIGKTVFIPIAVILVAAYVIYRFRWNK